MLPWGEIGGPSEEVTIPAQIAALCPGLKPVSSARGQGPVGLAPGGRRRILEGGWSASVDDDHPAWTSWGGPPARRDGLWRAMNKGFWADERGAEFVEWVVVTLIMIVATFAILQAVGGEISAFVTAAITWLRNLLGL